MSMAWRAFYITDIQTFYRWLYLGRRSIRTDFSPRMTRNVLSLLKVTLRSKILLCLFRRHSAVLATLCKMMHTCRVSNKDAVVGAVPPCSLKIE